MSDEVKTEIPGVSGPVTFQSIEDIAKNMEAIRQNEQQLFGNYITRLLSSVITNLSHLRDFALSGVKVFSEELELHRAHELQCRSQLLTEESLQAYLDGLTALRIRQAEENAAKIKAAEEAAKGNTQQRE